MRSIFCLPLLCLFSLAISAQNTKSNQFILKGKIANSPHPVVYLIYNVNGKRTTDSCEIKQGTFYFKGNISEPTLAILKGNNKFMDDFVNPNTVDFFMEPVTMAVNVQYDHFKELKITGSKTQIEYEELKKQNAAIDRKGDSLFEKYSNVNRNFMISHPNSYVSAYELSGYKTRWAIDSVKASYARLTPAMQNSTYGKEVKEIIDEIDRTAVGTIAAGFAAVDVNGKTVNLSNFKGKYVLLDFWGSWCEPCRKSTPHLIELFKKYKKNGLDVIAVAQEYDTTHVAWKDAIKKDGTEIWYNVLNDKKADKDIVKMFGVHVYPTKILIDKTGVIVGRYKGTDDGAALDKKLSELFD